MGTIDPHESHPRTPRFQKDPEDECLLAAMNAALSGVSWPARKSSSQHLPIVYVVGAPRSGTTLLAQLLTAVYRVGYVSNLVAKFYSRPSVGVALHRMLEPPDGACDDALSSLHGATTGPFGHHEFGYFWRHWLRLDHCATHHLSAQAAGSIDVAGLRRALEDELLGGFGLPLVVKNVICGFHAGLLRQVHEASVFVHIERDEEAVVRSILAVRRARYGAYDAWWSIKPSRWPFPEREAGPVAEVQRQVRDTKAEIRASVREAGARLVELRYETLCAEPSATLRGLAATVAEVGPKLIPRSESLPTLRARPGPQLDRELEDIVRAEYAAVSDRGESEILKSGNRS